MAEVYSHFIACEYKHQIKVESQHFNLVVTGSFQIECTAVQIKTELSKCLETELHMQGWKNHLSAAVVLF